MTTASGPSISPTVDGYRLVWDDGISVSVDEVHEHRGDELKAVVHIESAREPRPGTLKWGPLNLMADTTKATWIRLLQEREPECDWPAKMDQLTKAVRDAHRAGSPAVDLLALPPRGHTRWLVEPLVELGSATILFADGGSGKSLAGLAVAVTAASGAKIVGSLWGDPVAVLYLDWETDAETTAERLQAIRWGAAVTSMPKRVYYRHQVATLETAMPEIRRQIAQLEVGMVVVDSLGAARGGEPESADLTIRTFNAIRSLGVPALCIDHVTKAQGNDATRPFGSTYSHNLARLTWSMDKAQEESQDPTIVLVNRKRNNGRPLPRMAFRVHMEEEDDGVLGSVRYERVNITDTELAPKYASAKQRILAAIVGGGMTRARLSEETGLPPASIKVRVHEMVAAGVVVVRSESGEEVIWKSATEN